ncbi:phosphatidylinositol phosphatase PTPRQ [Clupea harengus]|uniref:Phosphatidylinositol phosphatase PTPRQ n=1 Tax=Clupea harengus TaxID=7950 RepID=A0A8M1KLU5_CLUHA|nr:phosphatidylinositol phosphatase PTPRQ [Clupea harengus]
MLTAGETYEVGVATVRGGNRSEEKSVRQTLEPEGVLFAMPFSAHTHSVVLHVHFPPTGLYDGVRVSHAHNSSWIPVTRGDDKVAVGDLTPGSEYDLIVFVTSGEKTSVGYHVHHVKTCVASPRRVCEGRVTDTSIEILWDPAEGDTHTYEAICLDCADAVMVQKVVEERAVFSGFLPGQVFNFSVRSEKESYRDSPAVYLSVRAAPSPVVLLGLKKMTSSITISWREGLGLCDGFLLSIKNMTFNLQKMLSGSEARVHCFDDLSPGSDYHIEVTSLSGEKNSDVTSVRDHTGRFLPSRVLQRLGKTPSQHSESHQWNRLAGVQTTSLPNHYEQTEHLHCPLLVRLRNYTCFLSVPVPPQEVVFIEQGVSSMYIRWTHPPGRDEGFWVQHVLRSDPTTTRDARIHGNSICLRDLLPGSDYEFSIRTILGEDMSDTYSTHFSTRPTGVCSLSVSPVNSTSVRLSWQPAVGPFDFHRVTLSRTPPHTNPNPPPPHSSSHWASWELRVGPGGQEVTVGGLKEGCSYNATVERVRGNLTGTPTRLTIHTDPASPQGVRVSSVSEQGFSLHWEKAEGCVQEYLLKLSPDHGTVNITHTQADVANLTPGTSYSVSLNAVSPSAHSSPVSRIVTTNASAPAAPSDLEGERVGSNGILLSWKTPPDDSVQSFVIQYKEVCPHPDVAFTELTRSLYIPEYLLNTLIPGATYNIKVGSENRDGVRSWSKSLFIKTSEAPPGLVTNLTAVPENHTSVKVTWFLPKRINGLITKFAVKAKHARTGQTVEILEVNAEEIMNGALPHCNDAADILSRGTPSPEDSSLTSASAPPPPVTLSAVPPASTWSVPISVGMARLLPYTAYVFEVSAFTSDGEGQIASTMTRTPESAPDDPPQNLVVGNVTSQSVSLSWEPPAIITGRFSYILKLYGPTGYIFENGTSDLKFVYSGLTPYTHYRIGVRAKSAGLLGPEAEAYILTTAETPSAVSLLSAEAVDSTSVRLSWRTPTQPNGPITRYRIRVVYNDLTVQDITLHGLQESNGTDDAEGTSPRRRRGRSADFTTATPLAVFTLSASPTLVHTAAQGLTSMTGHTSADQLTDNPPEGAVTDPDTQTDTNFTPTSAPPLSPTPLSPTSFPWFTVTPDNSTDSTEQNDTDSVTVTMPSDLSPLTSGTDEQHTFTGATASGHTLQTRAATRAAVTGGIEALPASEEVVELSDEMLYVVGSLRPFTEYSFSVSAHTPVGEGPETHVTETTREQVPSLVQAVTYQNVSSTSIMAMWEPPLHPNGQITHYTIYSLNLNTQQAQTHTTGNTSILITGLEKYSSYKLRVAASTMVGMSPLSEEDDIYVLTLEDEPDSPPRDLMLVETTASTATVSWQLPEKPNGIIRVYEVSYGNTSYTHTLNTSALTVTLRQLWPYTHYNVTVRAYTRLGHGDQASDTLQIRSGEDVPGSPPYGLSYESLSPSEVNVSWAPPLQPNGLIVQYYVELWNATHTLNLSTHTPHLLLSSLRKYTRYGLSVQAATRVGTGNHSSEILNITTLEDVPSSPPQFLLARKLSDYEVLLTWSAPLEANAEILYYAVRVWNLSHESVQNVTVTSVVVTVASEDQFNASVSSWTRLGDGGVLIYITFTTSDAVPSDPPQNVTISDVTHTSFNLSWSPPTQPNGILQHYTLFYSNNDTLYTQRVPVAVSWWRVSGVSAGVSYSMWLTSSTAAGDGGVASPPLSVTTLEDVPSGPVHNLSSQIFSSTAVIVSWDPPLEPNGRVFYQLSLQEAGITHASANRTANRTVTKTTTDTVYLFTKLRKYFPYILKVTPATRAGPALNHTSMLSVRTDEDVPSSPPLPAGSRNLSSSSILVHWSPPAEPNGEILEYVAVLQSTGGVYNSTYTPHTHLTLTQLTPYTPYNLSVAAVNRKGMGPSLLLDLHTDEAGPMSPPQSLEIFNHTSDSVVLRWEPSLEPNGQVQHYGFRILDLNTHTLTYQNSTGAATQAELSGFRPHRMYEISVCTYTRAGHGDQYSHPVIFTTNESVADAVGNLSCTGLSWDSVLLEWEPPANPNGEILYYLIQSEDREVEADSVSHTHTHTVTHTLSGLWPDSLNTITVRPVNSAGPGEMSNCTAYTHPETAPGPPDALQVTDVQSSSVTLQWAAPSALPGRLQGYRLEVQLLLLGCEAVQGERPAPQPQPGASCVDTQVEVWANGTGGNETLTLQSLRKYRKYRFRAAAYTSAGMGESTEWVYTHTLAGDPEAPPRSVAVVPSSSAMRIQWEPPAVITGPTSYLIHVSAMDGTELNRTAVRRPEEVRTVVVGNLTAFTLYSVTVTALTGDETDAGGRGKASEPVLIRTLEEEPKDPPKNLTLTVLPEEVTRVIVTFSPPEEPNGNISAYRVSVFRNGQLQFHIDHLNVITHGNNSLSAVIDGLKGGHNYSIRIAAVNGAGLGPSSEVKLITGIKAPPKPTRRPQPAVDRGGVVMVTPRSIFIQMPACFFSDDNGPIYRVQVIVSEPAVMDHTNLSNWSSVFLQQPAPYVTDGGFSNPACTEEDERLAPNPNAHTHTHTYIIGDDSDCLSENANTLCNGPLKPRTYYVFKFRATNTQGQHTDSEYSERVRTADDNVLTRDEQIILGVLLSFFLALFLILLIYASVRIHQRKLEGGTYSPREAEIIDTKFKVDQLIAVADLELKEEKINRLLSYRKSLKPVNKKGFLQHVEELCANDNVKFLEEFSDLPKLLPDLATSDADLPWNRSKNRFTNIKPYNNNRVKLLSEPGMPGSDYINASFISGYLCPNEFIATQGPLPGTVADFWRMIWETRTKTIAMLTQCFEKGRIRCHQYWPEDNKPVTVFGDIVITKLTEDVFPDWTVRALRVERHGDYMVVHHFNYTSWPEHGVPESSTTLIQFAKAVRSNRGHDNTTIVVHCSAGVGRTGVFMALDHLIQHVRDHDFVDIYGLVAELRSERMCMVQNLAQYMFLHQSTLDLLTSKGNSQSIWFVNYSALEKMDSLDAMEGDVELEWEETTM